jgi:mitotic spindle assembly checkpoint protein MAD1
MHPHRFDNQRHGDMKNSVRINLYLKVCRAQVYLTAKAETEQSGMPVEDLHARIRTLEYEVATLKQEKELTALQNEQDLREVQNKAEADLRRSQQAEANKSSTQLKYDNLLNESKEIQAKFTNEKMDLERRLRTVSGQKTSLEEERDEAQEQLAIIERESVRSKNELESRHATLQTSFNQLRTDFEAQATAIQTAQRKLAQKEVEVGQLEGEVIRLKSQGGDGDLDKLNRQLSEQVTQIKRLEKTNRSQLAELTEFRKLHKSIEVVEEEKRALETKLRLMENLRTELAQAQLRVQILEEEKSTWTTFLENQDDDELKFDSPEDLARAFMQQRIEKTSLQQRVETIQPQLTAKDTEIIQLEETRGKLQAEIQQMKIASASSGDSKAKARLERQKTLAVKETEYLRAQLKAFDAEEQEFNPERHSEERSHKIQELQDLVDEHRKEVDRLHAELSAFETEQPSSTPTIGSKRKHEDDSDERLGEILRKNRKLQEDYNQLQTQNAVLDSEIRAQSKQLESFKSSSSRTRILELRNNPTAKVQAIKQSTLDALEAENDALKAQLEGRLPTTTHSSNARDTQLVPKASLSRLQLELQDRDASIASKEKSQKRLRDIFAAKAHEFRDAVFSLLGWKLEFQPNGRVKATSMFNPGTKGADEDEGEGNYIVFDGENATMKVSGGTNSKFAKEIRGMIDHWVDGQGQVPCLLAAMTLEFYDRYGIVEGT